jgi:toxin FitB
MGEKDLSYLLDTNILIYYINKSYSEEQKSFITLLFEESFKISVITKLEFLGWKGYTDESYTLAKQLIEDATIYNLNEHVINKVIELRKTYEIKLADAVIAATALEYSFILVTRNTDDFRKILNIRLCNPFEQNELVYYSQGLKKTVIET